MTSTFSRRALGTNWSRTQASQEKLSSGSRVNRAADDAAGQSIGERNRATYRSMGAAARNLQDAYALIETANGALSDVTTIMTRIRELAVQAASDTISDSERRMVDLEAQQLKDEIRRISLYTKYNGVPLLDGSAPVLEVQADAANDAATSRITLHPREFCVTLEKLGLVDLSLADKKRAGTALDQLDAARHVVVEGRASVGSVQHHLESSRESIQSARTQLAATKSRRLDADYAEEASEMVKNQVVTQSSVAVLSQANTKPGQALKLLD